VVISGDDFDKILPKNATKNTPPNHLAGDSIISVVLAVKNVEVKELIAILRGKQPNIHAEKSKGVR
jgi:vacuolar-type H+-ATPase subunit C/Vma6